MLFIDFPRPAFQFKKQDGKEWIFDSIRKKWVRLTPEEWVRQNFISYLLKVQQYPSSLLAVEKGLQLGEVKKRCDIVVYKNDRPWMIVECKESGVPLTENTLMQAVRYNLANRCTYLVISNGNENMGWKIENGEATEMNALPVW